MPNQDINLPDIIGDKEHLARVICDSSKSNRYEKTSFKFDENENRYIVHVGKFIDQKRPATLSVSRISTITCEASHSLGLYHQKQLQPNSTYHGFAKILAEICYISGCKIEKDDYNGLKPYHANIIYPYEQKEDQQEIAIQLALHAKFIRYTQN